MGFTMKTVILSCTLIILGLTIASANKPEREYSLPVVNFEKNSDGFFVNKSNEFYLRYMWESFVALNWPNKKGSRDAPDIKNKIPGSRAPLVWETYPQPQEVFLLLSNGKTIQTGMTFRTCPLE